MQDNDLSRALGFDFRFDAMYKTWLFSDSNSDVSMDWEHWLRGLRAAWRRRRKTFEKLVMLEFLRRDDGRSNDLSKAFSRLLMVISMNVGMIERWQLHR